MHKRKLEKNTWVLIYITVIATVLFAVALFVFTNRNRDRISRQNTEYLADAGRQMASNIDAQIQAGYDNIKIVANLLSQSRLPEVNVDKLREVMENSVFDFIEFADTEGWDHTVMNTKTYAGDRKYFTEGVKQGKTGMELVYNSRATHETLLMFYAPVYFKEKKIIGAVIGVYQAANKITNLLSADYFGVRSLAYLATPEGRIVASSTGYDPAAENYLNSLPEGGCLTVLENSGWKIMQFFPEEATDAMVAKANSLGYSLAGVLFLLYAIVLVTTIVYMRRKHKTHQLEMQDAIYKSESANRAKTAFLNNMSHDIRTPLNAITGFNKMALNELGKDDEKVKDCLEKVNTSSETLLTIINDILEISRIESGRATVSQDNGNAEYSYANVEPMMMQIAKDAGIDLQFSLGNIEDRFVICDFSHINRIFTNIIGNAIKYTPRGGWVKVHGEQIGRRDDRYAIYQYTVEDNGMGMSEEFKRDLFKPFSRENTSTISKIQGTGLGLAMCKDLVDLLHGNIEIDSQRGKGTKVTMTFPFKIQEGQDYVVPSTLYDPNHAEFPGKRVLLVEDNDLNREISSAILSEMGIVITEAENGSIAVDKIREAEDGDFDLILMDIQMPIMDGYEATRKIRALGSTISNIPIVAMTANAYEEDRRLAMEAGMNDHLAKPIDIGKLVAVLSKYL